MSLRSKLANTAPFLDDFWQYNPDGAYVNQEEEGNKAWTGGTLPYIATKSGQPVASLPSALQNLLQNAWQAANRSAGTVRSQIVQLGSHRVRSAATPQLAYQKLTVPPTKSAAHNLQVSVAPHLKTAFAQDWQVHKALDRVRAVAFRGDKRGPADIKKAGGFNPPITRSDDAYLESCVYPQF